MAKDKNQDSSHDGDQGQVDREAEEASEELLVPTDYVKPAYRGPPVPDAWPAEGEQTPAGPGDPTLPSRVESGDTRPVETGKAPPAPDERGPRPVDDRGATGRNRGDDIPLDQSELGLREFTLAELRKESDRLRPLLLAAIQNRCDELHRAGAPGTRQEAEAVLAELNDDLLKHGFVVRAVPSTPASRQGVFTLINDPRSPIGVYFGIAGGGGSKALPRVRVLDPLA